MATEISYKIITVDITYMFEKKFEKCPLASFQSLKSHELKDPCDLVVYQNCPGNYCLEIISLARVNKHCLTYTPVTPGQVPTTSLLRSL